LGAATLHDFGEGLRVVNSPLTTLVVPQIRDNPFPSNNFKKNEKTLLTFP